MAQPIPNEAFAIAGPARRYTLDLPPAAIRHVPVTNGKAAAPVHGDAPSGLARRPIAASKAA